MLKASKVRIYPTPEQAEFLNRQFGATRFVYNKALPIISSKTCSCCGHKVGNLPLTIRQWQCPVCLSDRDRALNAAINIRQQGMIKLRAEGLPVPANEGLRNSGHAPVAA